PPFPPLSFLSDPAVPPYLPSFPTRRSSDLSRHRRRGADALAGDSALGSGDRDAAPGRQPDGRDQGDRDVPEARGAHHRRGREYEDRKSTRLNSSHEWISYAVFCLKKKK